MEAHTAQFIITLLNLDVVDSSSKSLKTAKLKCSKSVLYSILFFI